MFSVFAVAPIYNQGLPNIYDIGKVINKVFIYSFISNYLSIGLKLNIHKTKIMASSPITS